MKMVRSLLPCRRIAAVGIKSRADAFLHALDHGFVFHFYSVKVGPGAFVHQRFIADVGQEFDDSFRRRDWADNIDRNSLKEIQMIVDGSVSADEASLRYLRRKPIG